MRQKAKKKFSRAEQMFFSVDGLEQSTDEVISTYIAERFGQGKTIMDLTCSIGGNLIQLARHNRVVAVDSNQNNLLCAQKNAEVYGVAANIEFVLGNAEDNIRPGIEAFFVDHRRPFCGHDVFATRLQKWSQIQRHRHLPWQLNSKHCLLDSQEWLVCRTGSATFVHLSDYVNS